MPSRPAATSAPTRSFTTVPTPTTALAMAASSVGPAATPSDPHPGHGRPTPPSRPLPDHTRPGDPTDDDDDRRDDDDRTDPRRPPDGLSACVPILLGRRRVPLVRPERLRRHGLHGVRLDVHAR